MRLKIFCIGFLLINFFYIVHGASILALFSSLSYSDHLVFRGYVSLLAERGHSIVVMTPYPGEFDQTELENIVELDVGQESAQYWDEYKKLMTNSDDYFPRQRLRNELSVRLAISQLRSKQMTALFINPNIKFDLVITEADVPVLYAVAEKYNSPHIAITTSNGKIHQYEAKGSLIHPIFYTDVNTLNHRNLTCWQKVVELYRFFKTKNEYYNNYQPLCDLAAKKILGLKRDLQEVEYDIDMLLIASNPALIGNRPVVPAIQFVDRMHLTPGLPLPKELQAVLDKATKGVVYFSIGAMQDSEQLSVSLLKTLAEAFQELPFTVLWKIGNITMIKKPENVIAHEWFPQQQVLAHPNVKAFITHGGARSLEEAVFYKVPIVGFPIVRSRKVFIEEITKYGAGEIVDPYYLDKETFKATITTVVKQEKYKNAITKLKNLVEDSLISGPDNAVWWTEYVISHKGAKHLRAPGVGVTFFQYYMLDLLTYFLVAVFVILLLVFNMLRKTWISLKVRFTNQKKLPQGGKFKAL
ncbi:hypothetical protein K1T71_010789 [Dendrolimus kikuchii]|uniref:Uncharacterized protein n=1 Tax=Dendrolimus kikuchii TaxID=765133 RepID=A0ACC1CPY1_9NEOP|nr:hypothetical protein K1T71_010789 [Dendrolimus kikuchii]